MVVHRVPGQLPASLSRQADRLMLIINSVTRPTGFVTGFYEPVLSLVFMNKVDKGILGRIRTILQN